MYLGKLERYVRGIGGVCEEVEMLMDRLNEAYERLEVVQRYVDQCPHEDIEVLMLESLRACGRTFISLFANELDGFTLQDAMHVIVQKNTREEIMEALDRAIEQKGGRNAVLPPHGKGEEWENEMWENEIPGDLKERPF